MVAWQVDQERVEQMGTTLAGFKEVSHAYERRTAENWPYNMYTMVHGADAEQVEQTVQRMSEACGVRAYRILTTKRELKKVPPTYIMNDARSSMPDARKSRESSIENQGSSIE
jgi:DNA-binding Lrp family transcriptional regulator